MSTAGNSPILSIIIVSWNARELLAACLRSLRSAAGKFPREVLLVDNASTDGLPEMVVSEFPEVHFIGNTQNRGFAAANNQGMQVAVGRYFLLLNPDTLITDPEVLDRLVAYMEQHPEVAAAGPRLVFADGRHQVGDAGYAPTPAAMAAHGLFLSRVLPKYCPGIYISAPKVVESATPMPVDWICGAALMVRRDVAEKVGGLDESIFLYSEDVEWGCRMRAAGLTVMYLPAIRILHYGGGSENQAADKQVSTRWLESLAQMYARYNHGRYWFAFRLPMTLGFMLRGLTYALLSAVREDAEKARRARAMFAYARCSWRLSPTNLG